MAESNPPNPNMPDPPEDVTGEALLEWYRITAELDAKGLLDKSCRARLTLYVRAWAIAHINHLIDANLGSIVTWPNGQPGISPYYKVWREATTTAAKLLVEMGLNPSKGAKELEEEEL